MRYFILLFWIIPNFVFCATFTAKSSGDWNNPITWNPEGIPNAADDVTIDNGYTVTSPTDIAANTITMGWQGALNATGNVAVTGAFAVSNTSTTYIGGNLTAGVVTLAGNESTFTVDGDMVSSGTITISQKTTVDLNGNVSADSLSITGSNIIFSTELGTTTTITKGINMPGSSIAMDINSNVSATSLALTGSAIVFDIDATTTTTITGLITMTNGTTDLDVYGTLVADSLALDGGGNNLNVYDGGIVTVTGGLSAIGSSNINVSSGGDVNLGGDVYVAGGMGFILDGDMSVDGSFRMDNALTIDVDGNLIISDTLNLDWGAITGTGFISALYILCQGRVCSDFVEGILPIELAFFKGHFANNVVLFEWQTVSETNNNFFSIERSENGIDFYEIHTVTGAGTKSTPTNYSATDNFPVEGIAYYRLIQTDYDGHSTVSKTIAVRQKEYTFRKDITVFPLPYKHGELYIQTDMFSYNENVQITIFDIRNNIVFTKKIVVDESGTIILSRNELEKLYEGIYLISLKNGNLNVYAKCIVE